MAERLESSGTERPAAEEAGAASPLWRGDRETRPDEVAEAVMFAMSGGLSVEAEAVDFRLSHVRRLEGAVCGVSVVCRTAEPPRVVALHGVGEVDAAGVARLLDLTLMKLEPTGVRMVRVESAGGLAEGLWRESSWLERLPDLTPAGVAGRWEDALSEVPGDVIEVVQRALSKAQSALLSLHDDAAEGVVEAPAA